MLFSPTLLGVLITYDNSQQRDQVLMLSFSMENLWNRSLVKTSQDVREINENSLEFIHNQYLLLTL
ncbi:CLUMA_CG007063, isoform A [Clunio marinus]|uniref:CLUMA_CG007063, isoform A n=1 Tax=Clunio marinus TaxID=568069 RepID=A0A1J1I198_9DIPT|nr:CLUMA_CG007063, isoform A [Clunio marinus]